VAYSPRRCARIACPVREWRCVVAWDLPRGKSNAVVADLRVWTLVFAFFAAVASVLQLGLLQILARTAIPSNVTSK
jgi:hypothetical protein